MYPCTNYLLMVSDSTIYQRFRTCLHSFSSLFISQNVINCDAKSKILHNLISDLIIIWSEIEQASLFSTNEELDDLSTRSLLLMLIPAMLCECWSSVTISVIDRDTKARRLEDLIKAKNYMNIFTTLVNQYNIKINNIDELSKDQRQIKIWKYKQVKRSNQSILSWIHSTTIDEDDDSIRDHAFEWITLFHFRLLELSLQQEINILQSSQDIEYKSNPSPIKPFVLIPKTISSVFKPHYSLPTMTIDEYLERELSINQSLSTSKQSTKTEDEQTYKERQWDEFKEAHPRGSGNRTRQS